MGDKITDKIFEYIDAIAAKLGVATEYVLTTLIKQQIAEGIVYSIMCVLAIAVAVIANIKCFKRLLREHEENKAKTHYSEKTEFWQFVCIPVAIIGFVMFAGALIALPDSIMKIINPQYYALKEIMSVFGK